MMRIIQLFIIFIVAVFTIAAMPLPEGWRIPSKEETSQAWRNEKPHRYLVIKTDFNDDGILDEARLLMSKNDSGIALFAFVSQGKGFKSFLLDKLSPKYIQVMGIDLVEKGKYKTACGKGYFDCAAGEPEELSLELPSINYFKSESANSIFYWDEKTKQFKRIWISD
jgi:hypothetical protein